jgi:hypothetical protein
MIDLLAVLKGTGDAVASIASVVPIVKEIITEDQELAEVVERTRLEAIESAREIDAGIRTIRQIMNECGLDMRYSLNQLNQHVGVLTHGTCWVKFKWIRRRFRSLNNQLAEVMDDIPQILLCRQIMQQNVRAFQSSYERKRLIDGVMSYDHPIGDVLRFLSEFAARTITELGGDTHIPGTPTPSQPFVPPGDTRVLESA